MRFRALVCLALLSLGGCRRLRSAGPTSVPAATAVVRERLVVHTDFYLPPRHQLLDQLVELRHELIDTLALPDDPQRIDVFLFEQQQQYLRYMRGGHQDFPDRRACFLEDGKQLQIYAFWSDRVAEDLRHEVVHGYLHAALGALPLWLDEGLAEYYETDRRQQGLNVTHLEWLIEQQDHQPRWRPNLQRLEAVVAPTALQQGDYAEAWLWTYWLLHDSSQTRAILRAYVAALTEPQPPALSSVLDGHLPDYQNQLERFLGELLQNR